MPAECRRWRVPYAGQLEEIGGRLGVHLLLLMGQKDEEEELLVPSIRLVDQVVQVNAVSFLFRSFHGDFFVLSGQTDMV